MRRTTAIDWLVPAGLWLFMLGFTARYAVDVPCWDSWEYVGLAAGTTPLALEYLWRQHNEHRMVWEKLLVYAGWARATHWNEYGAAFINDGLIGVGSAAFIAASLRREKLVRQTEILRDHRLSFFRR